MTHLRLYRAAFAPLLAALVFAAFTFDGVPEPLEPPPGTISFDASEAARNARAVLSVGEERTPGSTADGEAADVVRERFEEIVAGTTQEQRVEASGPEGDVTLRNVIITLPGQGDLTTLIVAGRDSLPGTSGEGSAAATGALIELANLLAVVERSRTVVLASTSGATLGAEGARSLIGGLPDRLEVDAAVVVTRPGAAELTEPHLLGQVPGAVPLVLLETGAAVLEDRAMVSPGSPSVLEQLARLALPVATGEEAALDREGVPAIALSGSGEVELEPETALDPETLARFGPAVAGVVQALDQTTVRIGESEPYLRAGDNVVGNGTVTLIALALILPAGAVATSLLAKARRDGESLRRGLSWSAEWWIPGAALLISIWTLAFVGVTPKAGYPYDPRRIELGVSEVGALLLLAALVAALWWALGLRRAPASPSGETLVGTSGALTTGACLVAWLVNPYLALVLAPLAHLAALGALSEAPAKRFAAPALGLAALPVTMVILVVASELGWEAATPWHLVELVGGGGIGALAAAATVLALSAAAATVWAAISSSWRHPDPIPVGRQGQPPARI
ncbi:hypothetical protein BH24ACT23_BH24ACT23_00150 [soil metagenome]